MSHIPSKQKRIRRYNGFDGKNAWWEPFFRSVMAEKLTAEQRHDVLDHYSEWFMQPDKVPSALEIYRDVFGLVDDERSSK